MQELEERKNLLIILEALAAWDGESFHGLGNLCSQATPEDVRSLARYISHAIQTPLPDHFGQ